MKLASTVTYMQNKEIVQWIDNEPLYNGQQNKNAYSMIAGKNT